MELYDIGQVHIVNSTGDLDILLGTEEALTDEDRDWLQWLACESDDDYSIEDDYDWIRTGC